MELTELTKEIRKLVLANLKETVPLATKEAVAAGKLRDSSTKALGYTKLLNKFTP